jgi:hypothetical protein
MSIAIGMPNSAERKNPPSVAMVVGTASTSSMPPSFQKATATSFGGGTR